MQMLFGIVELLLPSCCFTSQAGQPSFGRFGFGVAGLKTFLEFVNGCVLAVQRAAEVENFGDKRGIESGCDTSWVNGWMRGSGIGVDIG